VPRFRGQRLDDDQLLRFAPILASSTGRRSSPPHASRSAERTATSGPPSKVAAGPDLAESERLFDALWAHTARPELTWYQQWRVGDLVLWDNRCVMHRHDEFDPNSRRPMHRSQIKGDRPFRRAHISR